MINSAELMITTSISAAFTFNIGLEAFTVATVGLIIDGVVAAPFTKRVNARLLLLTISIVLIATSTYGIYRAWPIL